MSNHFQIRRSAGYTQRRKQVEGLLGLMQYAAWFHKGRIVKPLSPAFIIYIPYPFFCPR